MKIVCANFVLDRTLAVDAIGAGISGIGIKPQIFDAGPPETVVLNAYKVTAAASEPDPDPEDQRFLQVRIDFEEPFADDQYSVVFHAQVNDGNTPFQSVGYINYERHTDYILVIGVTELEINMVIVGR